MASQSFPTTNSKVAAYNINSWIPLMDQRIDKGFFLETWKYGLGSYVFDFLEMCGRTMNIWSRTPKIFERLEWEYTLKVGTQIATGAAGADISFTIDADDVDAYGNVPVSVGDSFIIPAQYQTPAEDRVYVITDIDGSNVVTAKPLSADGNTITESQIGTAVPADTVLAVGSYYTGTGTGLPDGRRTYPVERAYATQIIKATKQYEGGIQAIKWEDVPSEFSNNSAWFTGQDEIELEYRKKMEMALMLGEANDNATLTETSQFGGSNKRTATKGIWSWAREVGQALNYAGGFDMSYLYDYKDLALANNVISPYAIFKMGTDLQRSVEEAGLDFVKEFSGGTDLFRAADEVGYNVRRYLVNNITFQLEEIKSWGNPLRMGNKNYNFSKYGLIIPEGEQNAIVNGKEEKHPSFMIGYLNSGGEDRTRITGAVTGTTGRFNTTSNEYDGDTVYMQSECAAIVLRPEQLVTVTPE